MPLEINEKESFLCQIGDEKIEVYFRRPSAKEMVKYLSKIISSESSEVALLAGIELAQACILGVKEGDIFIEKQGKKIPLITDPSKPNYEPKWKDIICEQAGAILLMLSSHILELMRGELEAREKNSLKK